MIVGKCNGHPGSFLDWLSIRSSCVDVVWLHVEVMSSYVESWINRDQLGFTRLDIAEASQCMIVILWLSLLHTPPWLLWLGSTGLVWYVSIGWLHSCYTHWLCFDMRCLRMRTTKRFSVMVVLTAATRTDCGCYHSYTAATRTDCDLFLFFTQLLLALTVIILIQCMVWSFGYCMFLSMILVWFVQFRFVC